MTKVLVRIPVADAEDLKTLSQRAGDDEEVEVIHPFDGATMAQLLLSVSPAIIPFFQAWLTSRVEARKEFRVVYDGNEITGYTAEEVERIVNALKDEY